MNIIPTAHPEVLILEPRVFQDERGFFMESYRDTWLDEIRAAHPRLRHLTGFCQDNHSRSAAGVVRGLHYQLGPEQDKLVRVVRGGVYDVAVDVRQGSSRFGQWVGATLSAENHRMLLIPRGFAHGFQALMASDLAYKCSNYYDAQGDRGIRWDDPTLAIVWPGPPTLPTKVSAKDQALPFLASADLPVLDDLP